MTRDDIAALFARRNDAWQRRDASALAADYAEDAVAESPIQGRLQGRARIREVYQQWMTAFPDLVLSTDDIVVDGNRAAQFITMTGTHAGAFGGIAATGRTFQINAVLLFTLTDDGHITHSRRVYDNLNMLLQIGALQARPPH